MFESPLYMKFWLRDNGSNNHNLCKLWITNLPAILTYLLSSVLPCVRRDMIFHLSLQYIRPYCTLIHLLFILLHILIHTLLLSFCALTQLLLFPCSNMCSNSYSSVVNALTPLEGALQQLFICALTRHALNRLYYTPHLSQSMLRMICSLDHVAQLRTWCDFLHPEKYTQNRFWHWFLWQLLTLHFFAVFPHRLKLHHIYNIHLSSRFLLQSRLLLTFCVLPIQSTVM